MALPGSAVVVGTTPHHGLPEEASFFGTPLPAFVAHGDSSGNGCVRNIMSVHLTYLCSDWTFDVCEHVHTQKPTPTLYPRFVRENSI
eukprot:7234879-Lingulodinium_polyedra.AAC.1